MGPVKLNFRQNVIATVDNQTKTATIGQPTSGVVREKPQGNVIKTELPAYQPPTNLASRIKFTLDNTADSINTKNFYMFDMCGAVKSVFGNDFMGTAATPSVLSNAIINAYMIAHDLSFSGFRAKAANSSLQYNNPLYLCRVALDGTIREKTPIYVEDAVAGTTYDNTIQNFATDLLMDPLTAIQTTVNPSESLAITWYIRADWGKA